MRESVPSPPYTIALSGVFSTAAAQAEVIQRESSTRMAGGVILLAVCPKSAMHPSGPMSVLRTQYTKSSVGIPISSQWLDGAIES